MGPSLFFFLNETSSPEIHPLSLPDALPISMRAQGRDHVGRGVVRDHLLRDQQRSAPVRRLSRADAEGVDRPRDRKSTRLNSSHGYISYAVFCLKKKKNTNRALQVHLHIHSL